MSSLKDSLSKSKKSLWKVSLTPKSKKKSSKEEDSDSECQEEEKVKPVREQKKRKSIVSDPLAIVNCTACNRQINPARDSVLRKHPDLSVLICKKCWSFYHSGEISKDEDGSDEQCRWCGEGGKLIGCDFCHNVFCKACILRNFGRSELSAILDDSDEDAKWRCYVCDKGKLKPLVAECEELFKKVAEEKEKAKQVKKTNGVDKKFSHGKEFEVNITKSNVVEIVNRLSVITTCFQRVIDAVKTELQPDDDCDDDSSSSVLDSETRARNALTLEKGIHSYLRSLQELSGTVTDKKSHSKDRVSSLKKSKQDSDCSDSTEMEDKLKEKSDEYSKKVVESSANSSDDDKKTYKKHKSKNYDSESEVERSRKKKDKHSKLVKTGKISKSHKNQGESEDEKSKKKKSKHGKFHKNSRSKSSSSDSEEEKSSKKQESDTSNKEKKKSVKKKGHKSNQDSASSSGDDDDDKKPTQQINGDNKSKTAHKNECQDSKSKETIAKDTVDCELDSNSESLLKPQQTKLDVDNECDIDQDKEYTSREHQIKEGDLSDEMVTKDLEDSEADNNSESLLKPSPLKHNAGDIDCDQNDKESGHKRKKGDLSSDQSDGDNKKCRLNDSALTDTTSECVQNDKTVLIESTDLSMNCDETSTLKVDDEKTLPLVNSKHKKKPAEISDDKNENQAAKMALIQELAAELCKDNSSSSSDAENNDDDMEFSVTKNSSSEADEIELDDDTKSNVFGHEPQIKDKENSSSEIEDKESLKSEKKNKNHNREEDNKADEDDIKKKKKKERSEVENYSDMTASDSENEINQEKKSKKKLKFEESKPSSAEDSCDDTPTSIKKNKTDDSYQSEVISKSKKKKGFADASGDHKPKSIDENKSNDSNVSDDEPMSLNKLKVNDSSDSDDQPKSTKKHESKSCDSSDDEPRSIKKREMKADDSCDDNPKNELKADVSDDEPKSKKKHNTKADDSNAKLKSKKHQKLKADDSSDNEPKSKKKQELKADKSNNEPKSKKKQKLTDDESSDNEAVTEKNQELKADDSSDNEAKSKKKQILKANDSGGDEPKSEKKRKDKADNSSDDKPKSKKKEKKPEKDSSSSEDENDKPSSSKVKLKVKESKKAKSNMKKTKEKKVEKYNGYYNDDDVSSSDLIMSSSGDDFQPTTSRRRTKKTNKVVKKGNKKDDNSNSDDDSDFDYKKSKKELKNSIKEEKKSKQKAKDRRKAKEMEDSNSDSEEEKKSKQKAKERKKSKETEDSDSDSKEEKKSKQKAKERKKAKETEDSDSDSKEEKKSKQKAKDSKKAKDAEDSDSDTLDREICKLEKYIEEKKPKIKDSDDDNDGNDDEESSNTDKKKQNGKAKKTKDKPKKKKSKGSNSDDDDSSDEEDDGKKNKDLVDEDSSSSDDANNKTLPMPKLNGKDENEEAKKDLIAELKSEDEESSSVDEDSDNDVPKKKDKSKKVKLKEEKEEENSDSDFEPTKKKRFRSNLLDAKISSSDSDKPKKKKKKKDNEDSDYNEDVGEDSDESNIGRRKKNKSKDTTTSNSDDSDEDKKKKKRKRIKRPKNSSDDEEDDDEKDSPTKGGRKKIRKVMSDKKVADETKAAAKAEEDRRQRVLELQKKFNIVTVEDSSSPTKCPMTTKLVLESNKEDEPLVAVNKHLIKKLKPHQVEAIQFMWSCCIESLKRAKKEEGSGCILAHCMGLGKTLSVVSFVHTVLSASEYTKMTTCLIVSPLNTVLNWRNECSMWLKEKDQLTVYELSSVKDNHSRARYLKEWIQEGGIMIIGYEMYRNLTNTGRIRNKRLKKTFEETLVDPGPDLVVCDEGHILKNEQSAISQAMNKIKTKRRIILTGTPLQNNLNEYHCMVSFVKPRLLGTRKEFLNRFVNPITNGQCSDSTAHDVKVMKRRAHVLHEMLAGCVQRKDYSALTKYLPPKLEYVISVRLAPVQMTLYEKYLETVGQTGTISAKGGRLFQDYQALSKIWTHPWVLKLSEIKQEAKVKYDDYEDEDEELSNDSFIDDSTSESSSSTDDNSDDDISLKDSDSDNSGKRAKNTRAKAKEKKKKNKNEPSTSSGKHEDKKEVVNSWKTRSRGGGVPDDELLTGLDMDTNQPISSEWWAEYLKEEDKHKLELSGKLSLLFKILSMCEEIGDKVLVFSQSLLSLDIIEDFLDTIDKKWQEEATDKSEEEKLNTFGKSWTKGADYFRMDGSTSVSLRQSWAEHFNDPENYRARLFIISTKAGGLGINLVGANRAIIFDASWNPSHDIQSIFRAYRFGQVKPVYIYRFLAQGTMEEKIYERQVTKQSLSQRVVDEHQIERHFTANDLQELYAFRPDRLDDPNRVEKTPILPKDTMLAELLKSEKDWIVTYHEHDSLLENKLGDALSEEERKSAWEEYETDKNRQPVVNRAPMMNSMYANGMMANTGFNAQMSSVHQRAFSAENVSQVVQLVRSKFPNLQGDMFQAQVQNIIMQQIMQYNQQQEQELAIRQRQELERLRILQNQVSSRQRLFNQASVRPPQEVWVRPKILPAGAQSSRSANMTSLIRNQLTSNNSSGKSKTSKPNPGEKTPEKNPPPSVDLTNS